MTLQRVLTGVILIPLVLALVWWGPPALVAAAAAAVAILALREFFNLGERAGLHAYRAWTYAVSLAIFAQQWAAARATVWSEPGAGRLVGAPAVSLELVLFVFVLGVAAIIFASRRPLTEALGDIGISAAGLLFVVLPLSLVVRLDVPMVGPKLVMLVLFLVWAGDTLAYFVGRSIGKVPMAPHLSPKKTWEGAAANLAGSLIVGACFAPWLRQDTLQILAMAGLANIAGQAGDLLESAYKRAAGAKDSGALLPGHGGMLDRIDALILAAPVVWYYFQWLRESRLWRF